MRRGLCFYRQFMAGVEELLLPVDALLQLAARVFVASTTLTVVEFSD